MEIIQWRCERRHVHIRNNDDSLTAIKYGTPLLWYDRWFTFTGDDLESVAAAGYFFDSHIT